MNFKNNQNNFIRGVIFWMALFSFPFSLLFAQDHDEKQQIEQVIRYYFEGMVTRDVVKLEKAFHPEARLFGYRGDQLTITSFNDWANGVTNGSPRNPELYQNHLLAIEIKGYTAIAKTELFWPGIYYYDYLTLIKVDGQWKIIHKTWYEEVRN
jgi:hypothetical protein